MRTKPEQNDTNEILSQSQYAIAGTCPVCGCEELTGGPVETGNGNASQEMSCDDCGATWIDTYTLNGYDCLKDGDGNSMPIPETSAQSDGVL